MRLYKDNEFCDDMNCIELFNGKCFYREKCKFTAKQLYQWLEENEFEIRKRTPNKYRCINYHKKLPRVEAHICSGVMRIRNLQFRKLNDHALFTLRMDKK